MLLVACMPEKKDEDEPSQYLRSELMARDFRKLHSAFWHVVRVRAERA